MRNTVERLSKICAQRVCSMWLNGVEKLCATHKTWKLSALCTTFDRTIHAAVHTVFLRQTSDAYTVFPTFHTPYKEKKQVKLINFYMYISGELA